MWRSSPRRSKVSCLATLRHGGRDVTTSQLKAGFHGVTMKENHPTIEGVFKMVVYDPSQSDYMKDHARDVQEKPRFCSVMSSFQVLHH